MGPHPAVAEIRRVVRDALRSCARPSVIVACSGGADSLALAAAAAFEAPRAGLRAALITIDHGLQPGSATQAERVAAIGYELGLDPVEVVRVQVGPRGGREAAARVARYQVLDTAAAALDAALLLGHTLDDQAETVLLGLGRGSGPRSIAGMRAVDGYRLHPLLGVRRERTRAACVALGLPVWDDPHNADPAYQRVRLRHEVLPLLEDVLQGGVAEALARTAALIQDDLDVLDQLATSAVSAASATSAAPSPAATDSADGRYPALGDPDCAGLAVDELSRLPTALRTRVLRAWLAGCGAGPLASAHLAAVDAMVTCWHGQGPVQLPGRLQALRVSGRLVARRTFPTSQPAESSGVAE